MTEANVVEAKWAIEIDHDGLSSPDYFAVASLLVDDHGIHIQLASGTAVEFARESIRKVLVVRTKDPA